MAQFDDKYLEITNIWNISKILFKNYTLEEYFFAHFFLHDKYVILWQNLGTIFMVGM